MLPPCRPWRTDLRASAMTASTLWICGGFPWPRPHLAAVPLSAPAFSSATRPEKVSDRYTLDPAERHDTVVATPTGEALKTTPGCDLPEQTLCLGTATLVEFGRAEIGQPNFDPPLRTPDRSDTQAVAIAYIAHHACEWGAGHWKRCFTRVGMCHRWSDTTQSAGQQQAIPEDPSATYDLGRRPTAHQTSPNRPNCSPVGASRQRASRAASTDWR